jgi:two-component sensor histidine kinase/CHASE3 domain sensor protein
MSISARFVIRSTIGLLAAGLVTLLVIVGTTIWLGERAQVLFGEVVEARDIRSLAVELRNALQTAESSQRGYIATSNEIYLAPYARAKNQTSRQLQRLQRTRVQSDSSLLLERLSATIDSKTDEMDRSIGLKNAHQNEEALALLRTNRGKALMDEADVYLSGIIRAADERLTSAVIEQRANSAMLRWISIICGVVIILVVGGVVVTVHRYTREITQARDEVRHINTTLEQRVVQRTAELARARDRAEVLLAEVNHRVANSLMLVAALVRLQSRTVKDKAAKDALDETQARIDAVSLVHKRLYTSGNVEDVSLDEYMSGLLDHLQGSMQKEGHGASLQYDLEPLKMQVDLTVNLGVVLAEWVTNAFKYAYSGQRGEVRVKLKARGDGRAELVVEDDGVGRSGGELVKGTGLGSRIVASMASTMGAEMEYLDRQPGTAARLIFPLRPEVALAM